MSQITRGLASGTVFGAVKKNRVQRKYLSADLTGAAANVTYTDLTFNNLVVGQMYMVNFHGAATCEATDVALVTITHNGGTLGRWRLGSSSGTAIISATSSTVIIFTAAATTLTFVGSSFGAASAIAGSNGNDETWAELVELNNFEVTTAFT